MSARWLSDDAISHLRGLDAGPDLGTPRYRLLGQLGHGGMGTVWLADDCELQRPVAIKIVNETRAAPEFAARLIREARILARLEHPGIVPVHAVGHMPDGRVFYVMRRVRGARLDEAVRSGRPLAWRLDLFRRVCETVAFAHAAGVLHRDLKPENVMVGEFGEVLVLDWGVAKQLGSAGDGMPMAPVPIEPTAAATPDDPDDTTQPMAVRTQEGVVLGTPAYMPPEQRRGDEELDARADVYALGGLLYFLLTGRAPERSADGNLVPPRRVDPGVAAALESICMKAMRLEPAHRYGRAEDVAGDVARFQAGERVLAHREGWVERTARLVSRYRIPILVVLGYLVVRAVVLLVAGR
jgi:serine/threonine protein kinase